MVPLQIFHNFVQEEKLFRKKDRILLAVSGGKDSVFMAHLFAQSDFHFSIAHCNFHLRGKDSDQDEGFVKNMAERWNVPFYLGRFDTQRIAKERQISIQMAARELRYAWLEEIRQKNAYDYIAIAHHQTDSVETVLINLVRGTGISGLHGILAKRNRIIRPILTFTEKQVSGYVEAENIPHRKDKSNQETKYARNKIRLEVLPALKGINPALESTFALSSKRFRSLEIFLEKQVKLIRDSIFIEEGAAIEISIKSLLPYLSDSYVLYEIFKPFSFSEPVLKDLVWNIKQQSIGKLFYSSSHQLLIDRKILILREIQTVEEESIYVKHFPAECRWAEKNYKVSFSADVNVSPEKKRVKLDAELISLPIELRSWKVGDSFQPLGLKGKKKVSDFFIDQKIPLDRKNKIPIFVNSNGDILWIAPYRIDERYKVTSKTKKVIIFEQL